MKRNIILISFSILILATMVYGIYIKNQEKINTDLTMQNNTLITQIDSTVDRLNKLQEDYDLLKQTHESTLSQLDEERRQFDFDRQRFTEQVENLRGQVLELSLNKLENEERIAELEAEIENLNQQIANLDAQILALETENAGLLSSVNNYETQISNLNSQINDMVAELNAKNELWQSLMDGTITEVTAEDLQGLTEIRPYAFYGCANLTSLFLPANVSTVGARAFENCANLTDVIIGGGVKNFYQCAFNSCNNLTNVNYLGTINDWLGSYFEYKANPFIGLDFYINGEILNHIIIPSEVKEIGLNVFNTCTSLTTIEISGDLKVNMSFNNCNYTTIIVNSETPPQVSGWYISSTVTTIYVPAGTLTSYQEAEFWKDYADKLVEIEPVS